MIRNIKALGLAFIAVAAMSMVAASAAQAAQLHAATSPSATITGGQTVQHNFKLTTSGAETKCTNAQFEGTVEGGSGGTTTAEEITVTPTYSGCQTVGLASQVIMNGCKYTITGAQPQTLTALVDVTGCTSGKSIEIKLTGCTVTVPAQTGLSHLNFVQSGTEVEVDVTAQGITYEFHGIACPKPTHGGAVEVTKLTHDGDYTGKALFKASEDPGFEQKTEHSHQFSKHKVGTQVTLTAT